MSAIAAAVAKEAVGKEAVGKEAAGAAVTSGGGKAAAEGAANYLAGSNISEILSPITNIVNMFRAKRAAEQAQANLDRTFEENKRRFGLQFALQEWSIRKGVSMQEASMLYQRQVNDRQYGLDRMTNSAALATSSQNRFQSAEKFAWARDDRAKTQEMQRRYSRGILQGLTGRKM